VNETQIILAQLDTERRHFAAVTAACEALLKEAVLAAHPDFSSACLDYLQFALRRVSADGTRVADSSVAALRSAPPDRVNTLWRSALNEFKTACGERFDEIARQAKRHLPVAEWRALSRMTADSIVEERSRYDRVRAALPAGVVLATADDGSAARHAS